MELGVGGTSRATHILRMALGALHELLVAVTLIHPWPNPLATSTLMVLEVGLLMMLMPAGNVQLYVNPKIFGTE